MGEERGARNENRPWSNPALAERGLLRISLGAPTFWIPAFAGMTGEKAGNDGWEGWECRGEKAGNVGGRRLGMSGEKAGNVGAAGENSAEIIAARPSAPLNPARAKSV